MLLPGCPREGVLASTNPAVFPGRAWRTMSVEQQAMHPINLVFMNLAGVPSTDPMPQVTPCLYSWGIVRGSVVKLSKNYKVRVQCRSAAMQAPAPATHAVTLTLTQLHAVARASRWATFLK